MFNEIRKKPKAARQQYAFWYAAAFTAVIAFVWAVSLQYRFDDSMIAENEDEEYTGAFSQFLSEAKRNFANAFSAVGTSTESGDAETVATTTESQPTSTEFILTPRAATGTSSSESEPRRVRIEPASANATSSENGGQ